MTQALMSIVIMGLVSAGFLDMINHQQRETKALSEAMASMDLQRTLTTVFEDEDVCNYLVTTPARTFNSTLLTPGSAPQTLTGFNQIFASISPTNTPGPVVAEVGGLASPYSNTLRISSINLLINRGNNNTYVGTWQVNFDSPSVRMVKPAAVTTVLQVNDTNPAAATITSCGSSVTPPPASPPGNPSPQLVPAFNLAAARVYSQSSNNDGKKTLNAPRPHAICSLTRVSSGGFNSTCKVGIRSNKRFYLEIMDPKDQYKDTQACEMTCLDFAQ